MSWDSSDHSRSRNRIFKGRQLGLKKDIMPRISLEQFIRSISLTYISSLGGKRHEIKQKVAEQAAKEGYDNYRIAYRDDKGSC